VRPTSRPIPRPSHRIYLPIHPTPLRGNYRGSHGYYDNGRDRPGLNSFTLESKTQHTITAVSALAFISLLAAGEVGEDEGLRGVQWW